jgi:carbon starvation protein CstA
MSVLVVVTVSALVLFAAYVLSGRVLGRLLELDPNRRTPAYELHDDLDYSLLEIFVRGGSPPRSEPELELASAWRQ